MLEQSCTGVGVIGEEDEQISGTGIELPDTMGDAVLPIVLGVVAFAIVMIVTALAPDEQH